MTYSTLTAQTDSSDFSKLSVHDFTPVGTDEDEYHRYQAIMGVSATGNLGQGYDDTGDLYDAGLIPDESGRAYGA